MVDIVRILRIKYSKNVSYDDAVAMYNALDEELVAVSQPEPPSLWMKNRKERVMPFFFIAVYYGICTYFFISNREFNIIFPIVLGSITCTILIIALITTQWKISAHSAGVAGLFGFIMAINLKNPGSQLLLPLIISILLCGMVMTSRLQTNHHNLKEVYAGAVLGLIVSFGAIYFLT